MEPAGDRPAVDDPPLGPLRGGGAARRPGRRGRADDLLPAQPPRDRADPALHAHAARGARPRRSSPSGSPPTGPATRPQQRREIEARLAGGRAARGGRHRRARARDRHRRARRGDLRHLPRHGREPAPDVGPGRAGAREGLAALRRRRGRARPVLLPPPGRVPRAPGRGGDPRPRERADPARAPARRGLRAAALGGRRDEILGERWRERADALVGARRAAARPRRPLPAARPRLSRRRHLAALGVAGLGRGRRARLGRAARRGRGRAGVHDRPPRRRLPAPGALLRGARARHRGAPRDRRARSTATGTRSRRRRRRSSSSGSSPSATIRLARRRWASSSSSARSR